MQFSRSLSRASPYLTRSFRTSLRPQAKVVIALYDDPVSGYPTSYARDDLPVLEKYPDGQTLPSPKGRDFAPGSLLGSVSGELGLREYLESNGHTLVVTSDKDGEGSTLDKELVDAEIVISQPFWPAYITSTFVAQKKTFVVTFLSVCC